ncbi:hypothetical protein [Streptomyces luteireticuli]|uniref:Uncharacterized protein n=1 Tax=Streptomyces luteireticuli TaxID=173858 RepID=A0ABN0Z9V6_9ACTN
MRPGTIPRPPRRTWTVEVRPRPGGVTVLCSQCGQSPAGTDARTAVVSHLAQHARAERLARHWRTCQCAVHGCRWHPRHRGCDGPVLLLLARERAGRLWRLTDACHACATVTEHCAEVPELPAADAHRTPQGSASARSRARCRAAIVVPYGFEAPGTGWPASTALWWQPVEEDVQWFDEGPEASADGTVGETGRTTAGASAMPGTVTAARPPRLVHTTLLGAKAGT